MVYSTAFISRSQRNWKARCGRNRTRRKLEREKARGVIQLDGLWPIRECGISSKRLRIVKARTRNNVSCWNLCAATGPAYFQQRGIPLF